MRLFTDQALARPLPEREATILHARLCVFLADRPAPDKDPELGTAHGGADKPWRDRRRKAAA